jgi:hypothetical protein
MVGLMRKDQGFEERGRRWAASIWMPCPLGSGVNWLIDVESGRLCNGDCC